MFQDVPFFVANDFLLYFWGVTNKKGALISTQSVDN